MNFNTFIKDAYKKGEDDLEEASKQRGSMAKFVSKAISMPKRLEVELIFVMWATVVGLGRSALNHPLLDMAFRKMGSNSLSNRHVLTEHLQHLDTFASTEIRSSLISVPSVSLVWGEWSDPTRRNWLDLCIVHIDTSWEIRVAHPEPVYLMDRTSGKALASIVKTTTEQWIASDCLIATATTDGAAKELLAGETLVICSFLNQKLVESNKTF